MRRSGENQMTDDIVIYSSRWKTLGIVALSFFFTVLCVFFLGVAYTIYQQEMKSYIGIIVGGVALFFFIFFGFIFICALYRIISPKLSVVIKMQDIMVYPSEWKIFRGVIWSFFFTILGIFIMGIGYAIDRKDMKLDIGVLFIICVGLFFTILFGYCLLNIFYRLVSHKPLVIINNEGILVDATAGIVRWEDIAFISPYEVMGQRSLGIFPKNNQAILARQGRIKRILMKINMSMGYAPIEISQSVFPISIEELLSLIGKYYDVKIIYNTQNRRNI